MTRTVAGHPFEELPRPSCITQDGKWLRLTSNEGDCPVGDNPGVRRVRLDGWRKTFGDGWHDIDLTIKLSENCKRANWIQLVELHDKKFAGAGPFAVSLTKSAYDAKHYIRCFYKGERLNQKLFVPYHEYHLIMRFKVGERMFVTLDGASFATILEDFGKGCALYPQIGMYSNEFGKGRMDGRFAIEGLS
ncbi:MAG: hypothetical protein ACSLE1_01940 [Sphingobium sp.]